MAHLFRLIQEPHHRRTRDSKCLVTGLKTYSHLKVTHIFPWAHDVEVSDLCHILIELIPRPLWWIRKGYLRKITDMADEACMSKYRISAERDYTAKRFTYIMHGTTTSLG